MKNRNQIDAGVVYSTEHGRVCPSCNRKTTACICKELQRKVTPSSDGFVRLRRETKGRKGRGVVVITGLGLASNELGKLAKDLKKKCGSGGAVKESNIEIQGDHQQLLSEELKKRGFKLK